MRAMLRFVPVILLALGCSKKEDKKAPPTPPPADAAVIVDAPAVVVDAATAETPGDFDFDKLKHEDKVKFMKQKVMPAMKPVFQNFDAKKFASVTCKTCHGKNPQKTKYKMPNPELPALDFEELKAGKVKDKKMLDFMVKTVKPEMAKILQKPEMTETQQTGFGCLDCHTMKKKKK
jgi:hypothetical protein